MSANLKDALSTKTPSMRAGLIVAAMGAFAGITREFGPNAAMAMILEAYAPKMTRDELGELAGRLVLARTAMLDRDRPRGNQ